MNISIIGLGKLGSPMAAVMAHKGHNVIGVDLNPTFVQALLEGRPPVNETGLDEMIRANHKRPNVCRQQSKQDQRMCLAQKDRILYLFINVVVF